MSDTAGNTKQLVAEANAQAMEFIERALGVPMVITVEDRLKADILEACAWIRMGAPERALEALEHALKY